MHQQKALKQVAPANFLGIAAIDSAFAGPGVNVKRIELRAELFRSYVDHRKGRRSVLGWGSPPRYGIGGPFAWASLFP